MAWVTACRPRMALLWKEPACSPHHHLQLPCLMEKCFTSVSWTEPNELTPYPEPFSPWAFSYLTSSTGSPIKCCDMKTSIQICKTLCQSGMLLFVCLFVFSKPKLPVNLHYSEEPCQKAHLLLRTTAKNKNVVLRCVFRILDIEQSRETRLCCVVSGCCVHFRLGLICLDYSRDETLTVLLGSWPLLQKMDKWFQRSWSWLNKTFWLEFWHYPALNECFWKYFF